VETPRALAKFPGSMGVLGKCEGQIQPDVCVLPACLSTNPTAKATTDWHFHLFAGSPVRWLTAPSPGAFS